MKEMKKGKLKSGRSGKKVTNPKQAIAIGLSEARKSGKKVPPRKLRSNLCARSRSALNIDGVGLASLEHGRRGRPVPTCRRLRPRR